MPYKAFSVMSRDVGRSQNSMEAAARGEGHTSIMQSVVEWGTGANG